MRRHKYRFKSLGKNLPEPIDFNIYTYLDKGSENKLEWAQVGVLEKLEVKEGVQLTQYYG